MPTDKLYDNATDRYDKFWHVCFARRIAAGGTGARSCKSF